MNGRLSLHCFSFHIPKLSRAKQESSIYFSALMSHVCVLLEVILTVGSGVLYKLWGVWLTKGPVIFSSSPSVKFRQLSISITRGHCSSVLFAFGALVEFIEVLFGVKGHVSTFGTGWPGYQFWYETGSPFDHLDHGMIEPLKLLRSPTQKSEFPSFCKWSWTFLQVRVVRSLKQAWQYSLASSHVVGWDWWKYCSSAHITDPDLINL